jgi:hypothetical protein
MPWEGQDCPARPEISRNEPAKGLIAHPKVTAADPAEVLCGTGAQGLVVVRKDGDLQGFPRLKAMMLATIRAFGERFFSAHASEGSDISGKGFGHEREAIIPLPAMPIRSVRRVARQREVAISRMRLAGLGPDVR